ncbi:BAH_G0039670.mRNA.1.CDS.1 [Saccharomyces cerevisiae]|nr:SX2_G0022750.mRNA.1.CDS.1 [Saccharomyces cerevisiae]CAI4646140.1 BAH_G0039670.mRNA.1.CDS.1 [Saccharomyces cerevisiae]CAI4649798.1 BAG_1a_G0039720.mRNA.1.CDS.1 [Saccharomyces cerevisiae]CAI7241199.1 BAG_1a_G0039720.mRNA.1.CDS.1 [Saccharomyces cerevisiae]CAI7243067.1 BAH_G0039670.mRNA.1.CDS.1 [Saccharomyces cerevisiae]
MSKSTNVSFERVELFENPKVPIEVEDEILEKYAESSLDHDMTVNELPRFFKDLQLEPTIWKLVRNEDVIIEGTDVIDFTKLVRCTCQLLILMNNLTVIDDLWSMLVRNCGRDVDFPQVALRDHVLSVKDLQKISNLIGADQSSGTIEMISCATDGKRLFMTYLDFGCVLGKLGYLKM